MSINCPSIKQWQEQIRNNFSVVADVLYRTSNLIISCSCLIGVIYSCHMTPFIHTYTHTYIHIHVYIHTYIHTHTYKFITYIGPCACSDWSKTYVLSEYIYHKANEEAKDVYYTVIKHSGHLRTLKKRRKHLPGACVFYISFMFSNAHRVLSQCNTQLRLLYLLNV